MSMAFEYGGIDREPVVWALKWHTEPEESDNSDDTVFYAGESADVQEHSEPGLVSTAR